MAKAISQYKLVHKLRYDDFGQVEKCEGIVKFGWNSEIGNSEIWSVENFPGK